MPSTLPSQSTPTFTTGDLAQRLGGELKGPADLTITHIDALDTAQPGAITFIRSSKFAPQWAESKASAALVTRNVRVVGEDASRALITVPDADAALFRVLELFSRPRPPAEPGVHATAVVHPSARIDPTATIGPGCLIEADASIGPRTILLANVTIGVRASVGAHCRLGPSVSIGDDCTVGEHCVLAACVTIGTDGFGYMQRGRQLVRMPHIGNVTLGDYVEIGANTCIDRAKFGSTSIGSHTKIDNLVQIGHNCRIGRQCVICGTCGLSGSVVLGDGVTLGGGVGVADGISIGSGAKVAGGAGVMNNIPSGETWLGYPAGPYREQARNYALLRKLSDILRKLKLDGVHD